MFIQRVVSCWITLIFQKNGYQFRGLNKNKKSSTGVLLLYFPVEAGVGNQREDFEQFELLVACPYLGGFIDIYH
ncbi:hypothetical protein ACJJH9_14900 [Microbulbifer sp. DLAB2-AF]|uniref:hypothetical protein n=1 Tax=Microbulbifer sp. DLAB2-AF TaxID=3243395 RepID=UPI00403A3586